MGAGQWGEWSLESCPTTDKVPEVSGRTEGNLALESHGFQHLSRTLSPRSSLPPGPAWSYAFWAKPAGFPDTQAAIYSAPIP